MSYKVNAHQEDHTEISLLACACPCREKLCLEGGQDVVCVIHLCQREAQLLTPPELIFLPVSDKFEVWLQTVASHYVPCIRHLAILAHALTLPNQNHFFVCFLQIEMQLGLGCG